jgi:hypothetical protein
VIFYISDFLFDQRFYPVIDNDLKNSLLPETILAAIVIPDEDYVRKNFKSATDVSDPGVRVLSIAYLTESNDIS